MDSGSKSDCFVVLWSLENQLKVKIGETEVVPDNLNPHWITFIDVDYLFEQQQEFMVEVYDADDATNLLDLSKHDFVGSNKFYLGKLVSSISQEIELKLEGGQKRKGGTLKVMATE
mmetsp:Transcript_4694/g.7999  ORF Transcript_4694/g.7999 Transcript_4694/m.7999 type:complete len:116 (-) Transcript_4694:1445-1792(-)